MKNLTEEDKKVICKLYETSTIADIAQRYKIGDRRVRTILLENNIEIRVPTKKVIDDGWNYNEELKKRYPFHDGYHYVAVSKKDGKTFKDYLNSSGALTSYLKENGVVVPSLYKRTKYFKSVGEQWYEQWFSIIEEKDEENTKKCPYCSWATTDVNNNSGAFLNHIIKEHGISKEEHLKLHPEDREYLRLVNETLDRQVETDEDKFVVCAICGKKLSRIDWRHLSKHGITKKEYIEQYGNNTVSKNLANISRKKIHDINLNARASYTSRAEKEIIKLIKKHGLSCEKNRKILNGKEIDIYVPEKKIGIEYDGLRWHSQWVGKKGRNFHVGKTNACNKIGVGLIHVFEDEFEAKRDIVENKILHILGVGGDVTRIMGRKCVVKTIDSNLAIEFLDKFHIQGGTSASVAYGAFYEDKLIAVMTFKVKAKNSTEWELTRFASDYNYVCQGVGGKLFKHFVREFNPSFVISFADRRWTVNEHRNIYTCLGFKNDGYTKPSYTYYNSSVARYKRFHKFGFRKERLMAKYGEEHGLTPNMTETEMVKKLGYDRIWDCGLIRYVWKKETQD